MFARLAVAALLASTTIVGVAPNPASDGDAGEFVVVSFGTPTNTTGWTITDSHHRAAFPNRTLSGTVAVSTAPATTRSRTPHPVVEVTGSLSLSNAGDRVTIRTRHNRTVDALSYGRAPTAERWDGDTWTPLGATDFPPVTATNVSLSAFVLPDDPGQPVAAIADADRRLYLAGYTITSTRVTDALVAAANAGVDVRVLVGGSVAGGVPRAEITQADRLSAAGVDVRVLGGERARYRFHHAKYVVADDRAVVLSENWKPSGSGGHANRGWGVSVADARLAAHLAAVFRADTGWPDARPWAAARDTLTARNRSVASGEFATRFPPVTTQADRAVVHVAPDNARQGVHALLDNATESVVVEQPRLDPHGEFTTALVDAAKRGVRVRVLLSGRWYNEAQNRNTTRRLNAVADAHELDLAAAIVEPRSRFEKVHVKGAVVDGERAVVGSLNWNTQAATKNREVVVVIDDPAVATYYGRAFRADWRGGAWRLPVGVAVACCVAVTAGLLAAAARIEFEAG
ncbi:phospholipase D-like domain-containing protein [Halobacterium salinarum]|uniref:Phosphatidylserine/phosphatidylglycerophosphate/ cardiolipin synthase n=2 Tax=Halobacterium salinarum TaxID=2242 RepID=A0A4D6GVY0_HALS9|nr:phospholipase D-like domain-containing protein [Halobacterium salinarum]MDL0124326.1 phospholipase D-like domain-containing protein [Halobacterium salinarum]MDL0144279.1 phospholipase D-like domain-containing protein [Halobacterium salinarum]QCC44532.1 phospholipase D domain protein [Halobacterium salinarum]TYO76421.1 Phosphatidylserine/phosphatidylglycerophosphate/cardiolipin synthase [Halobacterium salinarum DSM 3754]